MINEQLTKLESRLLRNELTIITIHDDIREIKITLRWIVGLVFSLNGTILGVVAKGFGVL